MESKTFYLDFNELSPSQLYLSKGKLAELSNFDPVNAEALPVRKFGDKIVLTDAHHRAYLIWKSDAENLPVYWDEDDLDWSIYEVCLNWCEEAGVLAVPDFEKRIISAEDYQILWHDRCERAF